MLKHKFTKKINFFIIKLLFCSSTFSCFAGKSTITDLTPKQQQNYISNSINTFFQIKQPSEKDTANHLFSPTGLDSCIATFGHVLCSDAKKKFNNKLTSLGIDPDMPLCSTDESKLQLLTAVLTRDEVTQLGRDKLNSKNIFLGEYLLQDLKKTHFKYKSLENKRQVFKENIQNVLAQKFNGNLNLDYKIFWSPANNTGTYLKVVSAIKFKDDWRDKPFENIGLHTFYTKDNKQIQIDFIEKTIDGNPITDANSSWTAIRIFYKQQYAIDIILPVENDQSTNTDKTQIIYSLINKLNQNKINFEQKTSVIMPKFEYKQKNLLSNYIKSNILHNIKIDYRNFLVDANHEDLLEVLQECYIDINEVGTTAEAITDMDVADGAPDADEVNRFIVNRSYFFVLSEYVTSTSKRDPMKIKKIIMIGEVGNPSE